MAARASVLRSAYAAYPERFPGGLPQPPRRRGGRPTRRPPPPAGRGPGLARAPSSSCGSCSPTARSRASPSSRRRGSTRAGSATRPSSSPLHSVLPSARSLPRQPPFVLAPSGAVAAERQGTERATGRPSLTLRNHDDRAVGGQDGLAPVGHPMLMAWTLDVLPTEEKRRVRPGWVSPSVRRGVSGKSSGSGGSSAASSANKVRRRARSAAGTSSRVCASHARAKVSRFAIARSRSHVHVRVASRPTVAPLPLWTTCAASCTMKRSKRPCPREAPRRQVAVPPLPTTGRVRLYSGRCRSQSGVRAERSRREGL